MKITAKSMNLRLWTLATMTLGVAAGVAWLTVSLGGGTPSRAEPPPREVPPNPGSSPAIPKVGRDPQGDPPVVPPGKPICDELAIACTRATGLLERARMGSFAVLATAAPFPFTCPSAPPSDKALPQDICSGNLGATVKVFSLLTPKVSALVALPTFRDHLESALDAAGTTARIAAVGCSQPDPSQPPDCVRGLAVTLGLRDASGTDSVLVLVLDSVTGSIVGAYRGSAGEAAANGGYQQVLGPPPPSGIRAYYFQRWTDQANPPK